MNEKESALLPDNNDEVGWMICRRVILSMASASVVAAVAYINHWPEYGTCSWWFGTAGAVSILGVATFRQPKDKS